MLIGLIIFSVNLRAEEINNSGLENLNKIGDNLYTITGDSIEDIIDLVEALKNELEKEKEGNLENQSKINKLENLVSVLEQKREDEKEQSLKVIELHKKEISLKDEKISFQDEQISNYKIQLANQELQTINWKEQATNYQDLYENEKSENLKENIKWGLYGGSAVAIISLLVLINQYEGDAL